MRNFLCLILVVFLLSPMSVRAELSDELEADFSIVEGIVVMPVNGEYIVTLEDQANLHIGDILAVVNPGKKVFHPQTREIIGTIDEVAGYLEVTRILSGYAYARAVTEGLRPGDGAPVKRFEQVPALMRDETAAGSALAKQIKAELPQFMWLHEGDDAAVLVRVTLTEDFLEFKNAQGIILHKYKITEEQLLVGAAGTAQPSIVAPKTGPEKGFLQQMADSVMELIDETPEEQFAEIDEAILRKREIDRQGLWMGPNLAGHPSGLAVADLDGDGLQEVAVALDKKILIARITDGKFNEVAEVEFPSILQVLGVDALDLDGNGISELYVSALVRAKFRPSSFVVEFDGSSYDITIDGLRWLQRAVVLPGEDAPSLAGQRTGNSEDVFSGPVFRVIYEDGTLNEGTPVSLPDQLNVLNFSSFMNDNNEINYLSLTKGDYLQVISDAGEVLWTSGQYFGGSEECFYLEEQKRDEVTIPTCVPPRILTLPGNEMVVAQNDGQRIVQRFRRFNKSRVVSLNWSGFAMLENWRTATQQGYLGDFEYADADNDGEKELVMAVKFQHKGLTVESRSSIVINELK